MDETKLRERLSDLAGDVPPVGTVPSGLVPRARRRAIVTSATSVIGVVAVLAVSFAGVRTIMRADPVVLGGDPHPSHVISPGPSHDGPGVTSAPTTGSTGVATTPGDDRITVLLEDDVVAIDPDNDPPGYESLGLRDNAVPLAWAPDGRIAFTTRTVGYLFEMDTTGNVDELVSGPIDAAAYSPDGTELVYSTSNGSFVHILGGSGARGFRDDILVGDPSTVNIDPAWAPDGQTIVFLHGDADAPDGAPLEIWAVDRNGSNLGQVSTSVAARAGFAPSWSPDGTQFTVTAVDVDGVSQVDVVSIRTGEAYQVSSGNGHGAAWSPDGQSIAFVTDDGATSTVHLVDADGSDERPLLTPPVDPASSVLWSRFPAE
jgi:dipeptidyl aminopeptidase/acylaminoacyl peptidase